MESWASGWRARAQGSDFPDYFKSEKSYRQIALSQGGQESRIPHQTEEQLEHYALGHLPDPQVAEVEEHLLLCAWCQDRLDKLEPNARLIRATVSVEPASEKRKPWFVGFRPRLLSAAAGIAVALVVAILFLHPKQPAAPLASLQLSAVRGDIPAIGIARETDLSLTDAPSHANLRAEVVDEAGKPVWSGPSPGGSLKIVKQLDPGNFFVRLYDRAGTLLHEYGFRVRGNI